MAVMCVTVDDPVHPAHRVVPVTRYSPGSRHVLYGVCEKEASDTNMETRRGITLIKKAQM